MLNIVRAVAAPLPVRLGGRTLLVAPPGLRERGMLFSWLACRPEIRADYSARNDGREPPPGWLPRSTSRLACAALIEHGRGLLIYATTRVDHPGLSIDEAVRLGGAVDDDGDVSDADMDAIDAICQVAALGMLARDLPEEMAAHGEGDAGDGDGFAGLESIDFGPILGCPQLARFAPEQVGRMTIDQVDNALRGGRRGDAAPRGRPLTKDQAVEYILACRAAIDDGREVPEPCP